MNRITAGCFALDHERKTARLIRSGQSEIANTGMFVGVHAQVEPFSVDRDERELGGLNLRLMGYPFNTKVVYRIVGDDGRV